MRTQSHLSLLDVPEDLPACDGGCFRPGGGLCCPNDPLDLVLRLFPAPHEVSLTALGVGCSPRRQDQPPTFGWAQDNGFGDVQVLGARSAPGGGGGGVWEQDSYGLSSRVPEHMEPMDVDKYLVDHAPDGGGEVTVRNPSRGTRAMPAGGVRACGALGGVVSNYPPPLLPPMSAGALHPYACGAPLLHAHAPPSARSSLPKSRTSSGSLRPITTETLSPAPVWQSLAWSLLKKRRQRAPDKCRKRPCPLDFVLHAVPVAPPDNPGDSNGNGVARNNCDNAGSRGIRRRRRGGAVPRQRNRKTKRVCSHCHSPNTPQWRAGPEGPGTLCNACGIRYAANKLLPEYRPSTAPSFRSNQHSNRHRKVVKLREQKAKKTLKAMLDPVPMPV